MLFAQRGTRTADFGAFLGKMHVVRRTARHEVGMDQADLRAVKQRNQMLRLAMYMFTMQDMRRGLGTETVTCQTVINALFHFGTHCVRHVHPPYACLVLPWTARGSAGRAGMN
jgi:hypothetical protein